MKNCFDNYVKSLFKQLKDRRAILAQHLKNRQKQEMALNGHSLIKDFKYWQDIARDNQKEPPGDWRTWLIMAGRGFGKTLTAAQTILNWIEQGKYKHIALIGNTEHDVQQVMLNGISGLLTIANNKIAYLQQANIQIDANKHALIKPKVCLSKKEIIWSNGALIKLYSANNHEQLRGPQFDCVWIDELAKFSNPNLVWDQVNMSLRIGESPKLIITTTPKPILLLKKLIDCENRGVLVTRGSTFENKDNLSKKFLEHIQLEYENSAIAQQELYGKIININDDNKFWSQDLINQAKVKKLPALLDIVIAIDPSVTQGEHSDETGIIVAGICNKGIIYIIEDASSKMSVEQWSVKSVNLYWHYRASIIIAENNNGGDLIQNLIYSIDEKVNFKAMRAQKSKCARAKPIIFLYKRQLVKHYCNPASSGGNIQNNNINASTEINSNAGNLEKLEQQMLGSFKKSPDRMDALVWAVMHLYSSHVKEEPSVNTKIWTMGSCSD